MLKYDDLTPLEELEIILALYDEHLAVLDYANKNSILINSRSLGSDHPFHWSDYK